MTGHKVSKEIGVLWQHTAKRGKTGVFLKGSLDLGALGQVPIAVFKNTRKTKENQPDYRIVLSRTGTDARSDNAVTPQSAEEQ